MSQQTRPLTIQFRREVDQQAWEQAVRAVGEVLNKDPEELDRTTVARELAEAYIGRDGCGKWREQ